MNTKSKKNIPVQTLIALALLALGFVSLVYCIRVEDEPGGISLLLILGSASWLAIQRFRKARKLRQKA